MLVDIFDNRLVSAYRVFRGCIIDIYGKRFPIDLIMMVMGELNLIVGMDWLNRHHELIDGRQNLVRV